MGVPSKPLTTIAGVTKKMDFAEFLAQAFAAFRADKVRATMTALGMVIGTSSLILVVTVALSGKQYVLAQIENIGTNLVWAEYEGLVNAGANASVRDYLTYDDMIAAEQQVPEIKAATPVLNLHERIAAGGDKEQDILVLGVDPSYREVRRMLVVTGRFFDEQDSELFNKVCVITQKFAEIHYGGSELALGQRLKIVGVPFTIIGIFRESMETFGRSEIQDDTILIPYTVARRLAGTQSINQIYFTLYNSDSVPRGTEEILHVIKSRHRPESEYKVDNLTDVLDVAEKTANAFTLILLLFAVVTLIVGGVGIMNIMRHGKRASGKSASAWPWERPASRLSCSSSRKQCSFAGWRDHQYAAGNGRPLLAAPLHRHLHAHTFLAALIAIRVSCSVELVRSSRLTRCEAGSYRIVTARITALTGLGGKSLDIRRLHRQEN
jgi:putative ABC transport system permease protein